MPLFPKQLFLGRTDFIAAYLRILPKSKHLKYPPTPPSNFVFCNSVMIEFGAVIEFDKLSPKSPNKIYKNNVTEKL